MALKQTIFNVAAFNDSEAGGNNYFAGTIFEIYNTNDTLADIFSDAAGANPINQDGIENVSDSSGRCNFYIEDGSYYIKIGGNTENFTTGVSADLISDLSQSYDFATVAQMSASTIIFPVGKSLRIQGENNKTIYYGVTTSVTSKPLAGGLYALLVEGDAITEISQDIETQASIIHGTRGVVPVGDPAPTRQAWDAISTPPTVADNSLDMAGHYVDPTVGAAYLFSGTTAYYSYIKGVLSITNGGDNSNDQLAGINFGYHCDVVNGSHCGVFGGSFKQVEGNYSGSMLGTQHQIWALDSVVVGGRNIKLGDPLDLNAVRRSAIIGGEFNQLLKGEQSVILGGDSNSLSANNAFILGGTQNDIPEGSDDATVSGAGVVADIGRCHVYSNGPFVANGDNQVYDMGARRKVTNNSLAVLSRTGGGSGDIYTPPPNSLVIVDFTVSALRTDVLGDTASWRYTAAYSNVSGSLVLLGSDITEIHNPLGYVLFPTLGGGNLNVALRVTAPSAIDMQCTAFGKMSVQKVAP